MDYTLDAEISFELFHLDDVFLCLVTRAKVGGMSLYLVGKQVNSYAN